MRSTPFAPVVPRTAWPTWWLKTFFAILFFGPIVAPLFQATGLPFIADSGDLARSVLSAYVCPTPEKSYILAGQMMAVCARCWGATIGLWVGLFAFVRLGHGWQGVLRLHWLTRLALALLPFLLWPLEIIFWPTAPLWVLLLNGAVAGFAAGVFFCSIWPGLRPVRLRW